MATEFWAVLTMALLPAAISALPGYGAEGQARDVAAASNAFALDLYAKLRAKPEGRNAFFSPYSIATALAMTKEGAKGQTEAQMCRVLHLKSGDTIPNSRELGSCPLISQAFAALSKDLVAGGKQGGYQMSVANSLWGNKGANILPEFLGRLKEQYGAPLTPLDFAGDPEGSRKTINAWVEKETQEKIQELLKRGMIDPGTKLVLANAIYFKGNWASQFKKENTREGAFIVCAKDKQASVNVPLMSRMGEYPYFADGAVQGLELPYQGGNLAMVVLLPVAPDDSGREPLAGALEDLEQKLSSENLAAWLGKLRTQEVKVTLPRFKVTGEYKLNETLIALGMADAFNPNSADFTGIISRPDDLYISVVAHKAYVDVNEEGTEAAAATAVVMKPRGIRRVTEFRADRSFVFLIRDTRSGAILFLGRVMNPQAG